jgi:3-isopropylmalate dehydratase small subunit
MQNVQPIVIRTLAVDLEECDLSAAARRRETELQEFINTLDAEGLDVIAMTEAMGAARYTVDEPGSSRTHGYAEPGTVYTLMCRRRNMA